MKALAVSIHDVAPATWPECQRLLLAVRGVAKIPVTLLVVPNYHRRAEHGAAWEAWLDERLAAGHELALHGYTHLDEGPPPRGLRQRFWRRWFTRSEAEFAALDAPAACERLARGCAWFGARRWPLSGFVAPAWQLGPGAWQALAEFPFAYTTTLARFHLLPERRAQWSPSLVYSGRGAWQGRVSCAWNAALLRRLAREPLVRLSLHPPDARDPHVMAHAVRLLEALLAARQAVTKADYARLLRQDAGPGRARAA